MDLSGFDVRAVPHTAAKAQQQAHSLAGTEAWLYHVLQEGAIGNECWQNTDLVVSTDHAYMCFEDYSKRQRDWRPDRKDLWSKKIRALLGPCVKDMRLGKDRIRSFPFTPLVDCRRQFETHARAPNIEWENEPTSHPGVTIVRQTTEDVGEPTEADALDDAPSIEWEPELEPEPDDWPECEPEGEADALLDAPSIEGEPEFEPDLDNWPEYEPEGERESD